MNGTDARHINDARTHSAQAAAALDAALEARDPHVRRDLLTTALTALATATSLGARAAATAALEALAARVPDLDHQLAAIKQVGHPAAPGADSCARPS